MLVLTRGTNESIMIGDLVELIVVEIRGDRVRLGIQAPVDIPVYRKEVYEAIQRENLDAARMPARDLHEVERLLRQGVGEQGKTGDSSAETPKMGGNDGNEP